MNTKNPNTETMGSELYRNLLVRAVKLTHKDIIEAEERLHNAEIAFEEQLVELSAHEFGSDVQPIAPMVQDCDKSPIETCIYDTIEDPCMDFCLYCGQPYERK